MKKTIKTNYFFGNKVSEYGRQMGYVDYGTLAKSFDAVLNNSIIETTTAAGYYWDIDSGEDYEEDEDGETIYKEFYQYYIISEAGAEILRYWTDETIYYNSDLDMYIWAVDHFGTSWDYVLTDIKIERETAQ